MLLFLLQLTIETTSAYTTKEATVPKNKKNLLFPKQNNGTSIVIDQEEQDRYLTEAKISCYEQILNKTTISVYCCFFNAKSSFH